jgi:hypothetical protein
MNDKPGEVSVALFAYSTMIRGKARVITRDLIPFSWSREPLRTYAILRGPLKPVLFRQKSHELRLKNKSNTFRKVTFTQVQEQQ